MMNTAKLMPGSRSEAYHHGLRREGKAIQVPISDAKIITGNESRANAMTHVAVWVSEPGASKRNGTAINA